MMNVEGELYRVYYNTRRRPQVRPFSDRASCERYLERLHKPAEVRDSSGRVVGLVTRVNDPSDYRRKWQWFLASAF